MYLPTDTYPTIMEPPIAEQQALRLHTAVTLATLLLVVSLEFVRSMDHGILLHQVVNVSCSP